MRPFATPRSFAMTRSVISAHRSSSRRTQLTSAHRVLILVFNLEHRVHSASTSFQQNTCRNTFDFHLLLSLISLLTYGFDLARSIRLFVFGVLFFLSSAPSVHAKYCAVGFVFSFHFIFFLFLRRESSVLAKSCGADTIPGLCKMCFFDSLTLTVFQI